MPQRKVDLMRTLAIEHLLLRLGPLNRRLMALVDAAEQAAKRLTVPEVQELCITPAHVGKILGELDARRCKRAAPPEPWALSAVESAREKELVELSTAQGSSLPLCALERALRLEPVEIQAVLACAAVEVDVDYERVFAFILDDLNRRAPCIELLSRLSSSTRGGALEHRFALGPYGVLRRSGVLAVGGAAEPSGLRTVLRLTEVATQFLLGAEGQANALFRDPAEVPRAAPPPWPEQADRARAEHLARAVAHGDVTLLGVWGAARNGVDDLVSALFGAAGLPVRRLSPNAYRPDANLASIVQEAERAALALGAVLWVPLPPGNEPTSVQSALGKVLADVSVPLCLSGEHAFRPTDLLKRHRYAELELGPPNYAERQATFRRAFPELDAGGAEALATRFHMGTQEVGAVERVARTAARLRSNGHADSVLHHIDAAMRVVTRRHSTRYVRLIAPKRGAADLVLPPAQHRQVMDVARFFEAWCKVCESWEFGGNMSGAGGVKALFAGDSGTGKTMAAEVIAGELGLSLLKVDLAQVVSKWVGETEKNLDQTFEEAEQSHAVLFFDEADALFGKRAEVQHGTDRYANLEVSYLLQRLEDYGGLVILASNLKEQIDTAFLRRFHVVVHFPRPQLAERLAIWKKAFPEKAPVDPDLDWNVLGRVDLTGAGIVGAARAAALLAVDEGASRIGMQHVVRAVARQFQYEARLLAPSVLGSYGHLLSSLS